MQKDDGFRATMCETVEVFEALERVNSAIAGASTSEQLLVGVLDSMLNIFNCDRAWLLYPCSLDGEWYQVPMERTRPEFPGAGQTLDRIPIDEWARYVFALALEKDAPVALDGRPGAPLSVEQNLSKFKVRSLLLTAIHPKGDQTWLLGIHHCAESVIYDDCLDLFQAIGRRVADGLTTLIATSELRKSEQHMRTLVEHAPEAIMIIDCETRTFTEVNPMAEKLFGLTRSELLAGGGLINLSPEVQPDGQPSALRAAALMQSALAGELPIFEWMHTDAQGNNKPCEVRLVALPDPARKLVRASLTDISSRKREEVERAELESRLAQAQKMEAIGNLTGGLAHDFNNLLTVILGNLDLMEINAVNPASVAEHAQQIRTAAERAGALTHRLLAFARRQALRPRVIDSAALLRSMDDLLRRTLGERVEIELVLSGGLWKCEADDVQLENAVLNLAINARDAMPDGGRLTIEASNARLDANYAAGHADVKEGQYVLIAVTDSGAGIESEILDDVFSPFFTTKGVGKGTGLGLSMVYGFVKQSGGHVKAYSEVGVGTTMKIYLPRSTNSPVARTQERFNLGLQEGAGELVLVVEDEEGVRNLTLSLLTQLGYQAISASGVDEALKLLQEHPKTDLLLTDVVLVGDKTGAELAIIARKALPDLRVLFMSGYTENAIIHNGRLDPDVNLLEKPFTRNSLSMRVREALRGHRETSG